MASSRHAGEFFEAWAIRTPAQSGMLRIFELGWAIRFGQTMDGVRIHALAGSTPGVESWRRDSVEPVDSGETLLMLFIEESWNYYDPADGEKMPFPPSEPTRLRMGLWVENSYGQLLLPRIDELINPIDVDYAPEGRRI